MDHTPGMAGSTPLLPLYQPMKRTWIRFSQRYQAALRQLLKHGPDASLQPAQDLGRRASAIGMLTLDVARVHDEALVTLDPSSTRDGMMKRTEAFFAETITPLERTHQAARKAKAQVRQLKQTLRERTMELAASRRNLQQGIVRRKGVEAALEQNAERDAKLLDESLRLQQRLRDLTHQSLSEQEDERGKISRGLHNEIAQTLLGINVRLLTLKKETAVNTKGLKQEIANTLRLVEKSAKTMLNFADELGQRHGP